MDISPKTIDAIKTSRPGWYKKNWGRYTKSLHSPTHPTKAGLVNVVASPAAMDNLIRLLAQIEQ